MTKYVMFNNKSTNSSHILEITELERDLDVLIAPDMKWKDQAEAAANKATKMLGLLKRTFQHNSAELWKKLYVTFVRPHLEFAVSVWNPTNIGFVSILEKVQARATKIPNALKKKSYEERLIAFGLDKLEKIRERGDLIQYFKLVRGFERIDWHYQPLINKPYDYDVPASNTRYQNNTLNMRQQPFSTVIYENNLHSKLCIWLCCAISHI